MRLSIPVSIVCSSFTNSHAGAARLIIRTRPPSAQERLRLSASGAHQNPMAFDNDLEATTRPIAVVNEAFVRHFFKDQNPIGQHFGMDRIQYAGKFEIVGVVRDIRYMTGGYKYPVRPMFWLSETQSVKYDDPQFSTFDLYSHF